MCWLNKNFPNYVMFLILILVPEIDRFRKYWWIKHFAQNINRTAFKFVGFWQNALFSTYSCILFLEMVTLCDFSEMLMCSYWFLSLTPQAPQAENTWCMRQLVYIENWKNCVNNYLLWNKVFLPQICDELVSCAEFRAILTPFSEVIRKPLLKE